MSSTPRLGALRIAITMAIAFAVAAAAVVLGMWQHGRHVERADAVADFESAAHLDPVPLSDVVPIDAAELPRDAQWRMVTATGVFDPESLTVLRTRPIDSTPAWQYLAWLDTDEGQSFLVSVGWIPQPGPGEDPAVPTLDAKERVTVRAVMREWEEDDGKESDQSVSRINPVQLSEPAAEPVPGYGMLREVCDGTGCAETLVGAPVPLPGLSVGPHLAYAWQWWLFAVMAPVGGVLLLRRDAQLAAAARSDEDRSQPDSPSPAATSAASAREPARASAVRRRRRRGPSDEEIEDAL